MAIPAAVADYNRNMGGVDLHDQFRASAGTSSYFRNVKWWHALFWWGLDTCAINSFLIYRARLQKPSQANRKMFMLELIHEMLRQGLPPPPRGSPSPKRKDLSDLECLRPSKRRIVQDPPPLTIWCEPECLNNRLRCELCAAKRKGKKSTPPLTSWQCRTCKVRCCLSSTRNCFSEHMTARRAALG